jgi:hypothetical protein
VLSTVNIRPIALPALLGGRSARQLSTVGIAVDGQLVQLTTTREGTEVGPHDGRPLDAVVRADPATVLGLAAGALALDDARDQLDVDGDEAAVRRVFGA